MMSGSNIRDFPGLTLDFRLAYSNSISIATIIMQGAFHAPYNISLLIGKWNYTDNQRMNFLVLLMNLDASDFWGAPKCSPSQFDCRTMPR